MTREGTPYDPESDLTQPGRPLSPPPGSDATHYGRGSSYPPGTPDYRGPIPVGSAGETRHLPPSYPISGSSPPVGPPPKRRRRYIFPIGGLLLVLLAGIAGIVFVMTRHQGNSLNTPGTPQAQNIVASATVTAATSATPTMVPVTPTMTPIPAPTAAALIAPALSGPTDSWTDAENRVTVHFPADWQKDTFDTRDENQTLSKAQALLQLTGPDRVRFSVTIYLSTTSLDEDVRAFRDAGTSDPKFAFRFDPTQDVTVGGLTAKRLTGSYMQNGASYAVAVWFVDHDGKRFALAADRVGTHRDAIDAIVASTVFVPTGAQVTPTPTSNSTAVPVPRAPTVLATAASIFGTATPTP